MTTDTMSEFISAYNLQGVIVGLCTFLIIGMFHPFVIKGEYYFGQKVKWVFLAAGIIFLALCLAVRESILSILFGVTAFSCFWSIKEVAEQKERVAKGWFPANPRRISSNTKSSRTVSK